MAEFNVRELVTDIETSFGNSKLPMSGDCCIYRVPHKLREVMKKDPYTPCAVSIGPLHHGRKELEPMETVKLRYLQEFIDHTHSSLHDLVCFIKNMEDRIRNCYAETILLNSNEFVKMILTDAAFIILHIFKSYVDELDEVILRISCLMSSICRDMMLLENQIPFFILTELYNLKSRELLPLLEREPLRIRRGRLRSFPALVCDFFNVFNRWNQFFDPYVPENVKHFTDLLRFYHIARDLNSGEFYVAKYKLQYNATELCEAGVNIKASPRAGLLGCAFTGAVLKIPPLVLNDLTTCLLQNLVALELCHYPLRTCICNYISLMGYLMETSKDVDLLVQRKILDNGLGDSKKVVKFVKKLGTHIAQDLQRNCHSLLFLCLNGHCENRWLKPKYQDNIWQKWLKILKDEYFSTPWRTASTIAAIIFLVLTFIQTVFAIIK